MGPHKEDWDFYRSYDRSRSSSPEPRVRPPSPEPITYEGTWHPIIPPQTPAPCYSPFYSIDLIIRELKELKKMEMEDVRYQQQLLEEAKIAKAIKEEYKKKRKEENRKKRKEENQKKENIMKRKIQRLNRIHFTSPLYPSNFTNFVKDYATNLYPILKSTDREYCPFSCLYQKYGKDVDIHLPSVLLYLIPEDINTSYKLNDYIIQKEENINWCNNRKLFPHPYSYLPFWEDITIKKLKDIIISRDLHHYTNMNAKKKDLYLFLKEETKEYKGVKIGCKIKLVFMFEKEFLENYFWSKILENIQNCEEDILYITEEGNMFDKFV